MIFVYKTTNIVNGKFYIGVHEGELDDPYLGSGKLLNLAVEKYGAENFVRTILHECASRDEAYEIEKELVTSELVNDDRCYNITLGGRGWKHHTKVVSDETKLLLSKSQLGIPNSVETNLKISEALKGKKKSEEHKSKISESKKGKSDSDETKKKKSESHKLAIAEGKHNPGKNFPGKNMRKVECPHCGKIGAANLMKRYHLDNCKEFNNGN